MFYVFRKGKRGVLRGYDAERSRQFPGPHGGQFVSLSEMWMKRKGICILLAVILCLGTVCAASAAIPDVSENPETTEEAAAEPQETAEQGGEESKAPETEEPDNLERVGEGLPPGAAPYDGADSEEPTADAAEDPDVEPDDSQEESPEGAADSILTVVGSGNVEVQDEGAWISFAAWAKGASLPQQNVRFRAIPSVSGEKVTGVALDLDPVPYKEDDGAWLFTIDVLEDTSALAVSFGDTIPGAVTVVGPGSAWIMAGTEWAEIPTDEPRFEETLGSTVSILAEPDSASYAAAEIWVGNTPVNPVRYTKQGAVFELKVTGPIMDLAISFEQYDQIEMKIDGTGTLSCEKDENWIAFENGARFPYDPNEVSGEKPLSFKAAPASGYAMGDVTFNGNAVTVTGPDGTVRQTKSAAASANAAPNPVPRAARAGREAGDNDDLPAVPLDNATGEYRFTVSNPVNNGVLSVAFLASDNAEIQWLRGSDLRTGISWAIPLGTSTYGISNVTPGSNIQITPLTQGEQFDRARTLAARFGSEFKVWDFTLVNEAGAAYEPTVPALFSLPIPAGYPQNQQYLRMLHIRSDGQIMECPLEVRTDPVSGMVYIATKADTLSTFILVNTLSGNGVSTPVPTYPQGAAGGAGAKASASASGAAAGGTGKAPGTADDTNLLLWAALAAVAFAALAAGARLAAHRASR